MNTYFLGIDTGGSKSHALLADAAGHVLAFANAGPGNPEAIGYDGLARVLHELTREVLKRSGLRLSDIVGAGFGIGGYDWPSQRHAMLQAIQATGLQAPIGLVNDALIALLAGAAQGWGVAVVAGTSCNAWGQDATGNQGRMVGQGDWAGEGAGAMELVAEAIKAVARAWTRQAPPTNLTQALIRRVQARDAADLLEGLNLGRFELDASAAPLIFHVAAQGDAVAHDLILWAGRQLGNMANGIIRQLHFENQAFEIVLAGSFYNGSKHLLEAMRGQVRLLAPNARFVHLQAPPVVGGVLLAAKQAGYAPLSLRQQLLQSTHSLLIDSTWR